MPSAFDQPHSSAGADDLAAEVPPVDAVPSEAPLQHTTLPPTKRHSLSRAAWFALVIGVVVLIFMLVFILQNNVPAQFTFLAWTFAAPLGVAVLFAGIGGALITVLVGAVRMISLGRNVRSLERERTTT